MAHFSPGFGLPLARPHRGPQRRAPGWFAALLLTACAAGSGPSPGDELRALGSFVTALHPAPFAHVAPQRFTTLVEGEAEALDASATLNEWQRGAAFARVLASLEDGHLALALPAWQPDRAASLSLLPVLPKRAGTRWFVDAAQPPLPVGSELLTIDGRSLDQVYDTLLPLVFADVASRTPRESILEARFTQLYHLHFGVRERYRLGVRTPEGRAQTLEVAGLPLADLSELARGRQSAPVWGAVDAPSLPVWRRLDGHTAVLRLASFGEPDQDGYAARVAELLGELRAEDTLVLDLRGNQGGFRTHGIAVLNLLLARPYAQWTAVRSRVRAIPPAHRAHVSFPVVPEEALRDAGLTAEGDGFVRRGDPLAPRMVPRGTGHPGPIVVLMNGLTASAAVEMISALVAQRPDVRLVGEETGGGCARHIGELPVAYASEPSGLRVLMSLFEVDLVSARSCTGEGGHVPDLPVVYDAADFLGGRDPYFEAAMHSDRAQGQAETSDTTPSLPWR